jgi:hypothetical protein
MEMEELHRIHKDVPFGYWVDWVVPAAKAIRRALKALTASRGAQHHVVTLR